MKLLVIGSGGREHAIAWRLAQSPRVSRVFVAPGNAGTALEDGVANVDVQAIPDLVRYARDNGIHTTVVGPEGPLAEGVVTAWPKFFPVAQMVLCATAGFRYLLYPDAFGGRWLVSSSFPECGLIKAKFDFSPEPGLAESTSTERANGGNPNLSG